MEIIWRDRFEGEQSKKCWTGCTNSHNYSNATYLLCPFGIIVLYIQMVASAFTVLSPTQFATFWGEWPMMIEDLLWIKHTCPSGTSLSTSPHSMALSTFSFSAVPSICRARCRPTRRTSLAPPPQPGDTPILTWTNLISKSTVTTITSYTSCT